MIQSILLQHRLQTACVCCKLSISCLCVPNKSALTGYPGRAPFHSGRCQISQLVLLDFRGVFPLVEGPIQIPRFKPGAVMQAALPWLLAVRADVKFEEMPMESIRKLLELF